MASAYSGISQRKRSRARAESSGVLASNEVHDLAVAIGCDPGHANIEGLRYGKIIMMSDADVDRVVDGVLSAIR